MIGNITCWPRHEIVSVTINVIKQLFTTQECKYIFDMCRTILSGRFHGDVLVLVEIYSRMGAPKQLTEMHNIVSTIFNIY